ncbi:hypothetical protein FXO38_29762 [Capsicum annuum]|nr:hypothetical protein FXO38_29762 [Capsicum annuum]KAF3643564.1 hypothetical protein FXO37_21928 [Capsicum annuum]
MDSTPVRGSTFLDGCDSPSVVEKLYEEHKGKCEALEDELIKHLFTCKGGVYVDKLLLNEQDPLTKSIVIYQKIVREYLLARSLRRDTDAAEPQQSGRVDQCEKRDATSRTRPTKRSCSRVLLL